MGASTDRAIGEDPPVLAHGAVYRVSYDVDFGLKRGLSVAETDTPVLQGMAYRL